MAPTDDPTTEPRVTVIIPSFNDGALIRETLDSIREPEPVDVVIVDDCSDDAATHAVYAQLEAEGYRVLRHDRNRGVAAARNTGVRASTTSYVLNLDADDLLLPGSLSRLASLLDAHPEADVAYGDYEEFGAREGVRHTARVLDPYRVAYVNKSPGLAMFRRTLLEDAGGWPEDGGYEDWELWMSLAERGRRIVHSGDVVFRYRVDLTRGFGRDRQRHAEVYTAIRARHPGIFEHLREHRRRSALPWYWKLLYPVLYAGGLPRFERARAVVRSLVPRWSPALARSGDGRRPMPESR